jgi:hypothetical protein
VNNENVFFPQRSWRGEENVRLSQLPRPIKIKEEKHLSLLFAVLAEGLQYRFLLIKGKTCHGVTGFHVINT